jgi:predicted aminopeptidase
MGVVWDRESLSEERIAELSPREQANLVQLREALRFGASLGLAESTGYRHLLDRSEDQSLRLVVAAPPDRIEAVSWWFPIVGRMSYRGYFDPSRADAFAAALAADGYDTYVRSAAAYSTLGWFDDPVPRPMLSWPEVDLVNTILHELVHETVFAAGDTGYSEAFATFVANQATLRFYADRPEARAQARAQFADQRRFAALIAELADELEQLYASVETAEQAREARRPVFARYQGEVYARQDWQTHRYSDFPEAPLSNAWLVAHTTYVGEIACFEAWLRELDGDLVGFIALHSEQPGARNDALVECRGA